MKNYIKSMIAIVALLLCSTVTQADNVVVIKQLNGTASDTGGTVTVDKTTVSGGETVTITVEPATGYYLDPDDISVVMTIDGSKAQTREPGFYEPLAVTHASGNDVSGTATYTFVMPSTGGSNVSYGAEVTVNFSQRISISTATVTASGTFSYTGETIEPESITVKLGSSTLTVTTDYTLEFSNNKNAGTATITVTGVGKYTGTANGGFTIGKAAIDAVTLDKTELEYTDAAQTVSVTKVMAGTIELTSDDYVVSGNTATDAGTYTVTVSAKDGSNFTGSKTAGFTIGKASIDAVTLDKTTLTYTGSVQTVSVTKVMAGTIELTADDYVVSGNTATDAGTYTVTVSAKDGGNFTGSATAEFTITEPEPEKTKVELKFSTDKVEINYGDAFTAPTLTKTPETLTGITFKSSRRDVAKVDNDGKVTIEGNGQTTITASFAANEDYEGAEASYILIVNNGKIDYTVKDYDGTYDGQPHTITLTVNSPEGASVEYSYGEGTQTEYSTTAPTFTDVGYYTVNYYITKDHYETVSNSATVYITPATAQITKEPTVIEGLVYTGYPLVLVYAGECTGGTMVYSLNNKDWSQELPMATEAGTYKVYCKVVAANQNYYDSVTKEVAVTIAKKEEEEPEPEPEEKTYNLWVAGVQVTDNNKSNILKDDKGKVRFYFSDKDNQLVITNNQEPTIVVESGLDNLTIYLNGTAPSYLERIWSSVGGREVSHPNKGALTITTYPNVPGKLFLKTDHTYGVIGKFSSLTIDENTKTILMSPEGGYFDGYLLKADGGIAKSATIGQYIVPMGNETRTFPNSNFQNPDGTDKDLSNTTVDDKNKVLFTANTAASNPEENDGYDASDNSIVLNTIQTSSDIQQVANDVLNNILTPGTEEFAQAFHGLTFMVPEKIYLFVNIEPGYILRVKVLSDISGANATITSDYNSAVVDYQVEESSYVLVWMAKDTNYSREGTRLGKRETAHGRVYSLKVEPITVATKNPLSIVTDFPKDEVEEIEAGGGGSEPTPAPTPPTSIDAVEDSTHSNVQWYTISGLRINKPTQKGLYIKDGKKIVIK